MADLDKTINDLIEIEANMTFYKHPESAKVVRDAIELLKEKQPRKPHYTILRYLVCGKEVAVTHPECPRCVENGFYLWDAEVEKNQAFCKRCGQALDWKDGDGE